MDERNYYIAQIQGELERIEDTEELRAVWGHILIIAEDEIGSYALLQQLIELLKDDTPKIRQILAYTKGKLG